MEHLPQPDALQEWLIPHQFTNEELLAICRRQADLLERMADQEALKVKTVKQCDRQIAVLRQALTVSAQEFRNASQPRPVKFLVAFDMTQQTKTAYHPDDAAKRNPVATMPMTKDDFILPLPLA